MLKFSYQITKNNICKIVFIIIITLIRAFVLLLPAYLIKVIINHILPTKNVLALIALAILIAIIPFFTNFLINLDLKLSAYILDNGQLLAEKIAASVIFLGIHHHNKKVSYFIF